MLTTLLLTALLIEPLGSSRFAVREQAQRRLALHVGTLYPLLTAAEAGYPSLEVQRRITAVLRPWRMADADRAVRLLTDLPHIDTLTTPRMAWDSSFDQTPYWNLIAECLSNAQIEAKRPGFFPWKQIGKSNFWHHSAPPELQILATRIMVRSRIVQDLPYDELLADMRRERDRRLSEAWQRWGW